MLVGADWVESGSDLRKLRAYKSYLPSRPGTPQNRGLISAFEGQGIREDPTERNPRLEKWPVTFLPEQF